MINSVLGIDGENEVIRSIMKWLEHDAEDRITHIKDILNLVKLNHVSDAVINEVMTLAVISDRRGRYFIK